MPAAGRRGAAASLALVGVMWLLPFVQPYHWYPLTSFYSEWLAIALGIAASFVLAGRAGGAGLQLPVIALLPVALAALIMVQYLLGGLPYAGPSLTAALYLVWATLLVALGAYLRRIFGLTVVATVLAWFLVAGGLMNAAAGFLQHFQISTLLDAVVSKSNATYVYGNLAQRNHYANYLTLGLVSLVYLFARGSLGRVAAAVCAAPILLALPLAGSRSVWLYLAALLALALWPVAEEKRGSVDRMRVLLVCATGGFVLAQWIASLPWFAPPLGAEAPSERLFDVATGTAERFQLWREAWWMFAQSPLAGVGIGQYAWQHVLFQGAFPGTLAIGNFNHAHNVLLQLMAETGLFGAALIVAAAILWIWGLRGARLGLEHWWLLGLLAVIGVHSMLEMPLWYSYFVGVSAIALGLGATRFVALKPRPLTRVALMLILATGVVNAAGVFTSYRGFEPLFVRAPGALGGSELEQIVMRTHRDVLLAPYAELAASFGIVVDEAGIEEKLELNGRVMRFVPLDVVVYRQALLLAMHGERRKAEEMLALAARVYPLEVDNTIAKLRHLDRKYPDRFGPLLELATANSGLAPASHTTR